MTQPDSANTLTPRDPHLRAVNDSMLDGLGKLADYFGYNKVLGKMYGALLLSPLPMSLDDLMVHLDISKASVSMNMRMLENIGLAREVWVRGDRRKYYEAESDLWRALTNVLGSRELRDVNKALGVLETNIERLRMGADSMSEGERELAHFYVGRIDQMKDFFQLAELILTSIIDRDHPFDMPKDKAVDVADPAEAFDDSLNDLGEID
jgi:DNA-binding transcriptional regulator GbsR (MarR family)